MRPVVATVAVVALVVAAASTGAAPAATQQQQGTVVGSPSLTAAATDTRLAPGERANLTVRLANAGGLTRGGPERFEERVQTARNVRVAVATDRLAPALAEALEVRSGGALLGRLGPAAVTDVVLTVAAASDLPPGEYELPLEVTYEYTSFVRYGTGEPEYNDASRTRLVRVPVTVASAPRLSVSAASETGVTPGETGVLSFTVANVGTESATETALSLTVDGVAVHFGARDRSGTTTRLFLGSLAPGETRTVNVTGGAYPGTQPGVYLVAATATFSDPDGLDTTQDDLRAGLRVVAANGTAP